MENFDWKKVFTGLALAVAGAIAEYLTNFLHLISPH